MGLDPALGLMHIDTRHRGSMAGVDVMEPGRPLVDGLVIDRLVDSVLARGDVIETREGVCRLGPELARQLAASASQLRSSLAPEVGHLRSRLLARGPAGRNLNVFSLRYCRSAESDGSSGIAR